MTRAAAADAQLTASRFTTSQSTAFEFTASDPATGGAARIAAFAASVRLAGLDAGVRHAARRHFLDTVGVMVAGSAFDVATRAEAMLAAVRGPGAVPVPGRARRADLLDAAFLGGTAAHGIELDDGYRQGSVHPGAAVVPAALAAGCMRRASGTTVLEAIVAGYETVIALARACHPGLRLRGFHPTGACGPFGAAVAAGRVLGLTPARLADAVAIAASSAAGVFAFVGGGADVKRLHAGHAAREGLQAALLAAQGVAGPPAAVDGRDGFLQAFAERPAALALPPETAFDITDCYIKPWPCCRHLQPAVAAVIGLCHDEDIAPAEVSRIDVDTYRIAAAHAATGWTDFASAQLSFPYVMSLAVRFRAVRLEHFRDDCLKDPAADAVAARLCVTASPEVDRLYPQLRPARVTMTTTRGVFSRAADEALGSRLVPLGDAALREKFHDLVAPVLSAPRARALADLVWNIEACADVGAVAEAAALPAR
jgi:2-methylcitrate dehydratase PrpD